MANEPRFEACLAEVLRHEGGYVDHPDDPGGATNMGITRKTLARWRKIPNWQDLPKSEVAALTLEEAGRIYRASYWAVSGADRMPAGLDLALFDFAVHSGPDRAIRTLQAALGVAADGIVGSQTIGAAGSKDTGTIISDLCDRRLGFLQRLPTFAVFGKGWTRRVGEVRAASLNQVQPSKRRMQVDFLSGYRTYIVAALMLLTGIARFAGIDIPAVDGGSAGSLILEALAIIFLRKGLKTELGGKP
jgi:lysozyme family protein